MYLCVCCMYYPIYMFAVLFCTYVCTYTHTYVCIVHIYCTQVDMIKLVYCGDVPPVGTVHAYTYVCVCTYVRTYVYVCNVVLCMYVCIHTYVCTCSSLSFTSPTHIRMYLSGSSSLIQTSRWTQVTRSVGLDLGQCRK